MTNQLTTLAALPSGAGAKSALPAEVGRAPEPKYACGGYVGNVPVANTDTSDREASQPGNPAITINFRVGDMATTSQMDEMLKAVRGRPLTNIGNPDGKRLPDEDGPEIEVPRTACPIIDTIVDVFSASVVKQAFADPAARIWVSKTLAATDMDEFDEETRVRIERIRQSLGWTTAAVEEKK